MSKLSQEALQEQIKELDELIELAESISSEMSVVITKSNRITVYALLILIFCPILYGYYFTDFTFCGVNSLIVTVIIILVALLAVNLQWRRVKVVTNRDGVVLDRLYNMISNHKQSIQSQLGLISNAIYEMKLSRIRFHFSAQENPSNSWLGYFKSIFLTFRDL